MPAVRHTSAAFLQFLDRVVATQSPRPEIHLIADTRSAHKTKAVSAWHDAHPRVTLQFTPSYSSWLNQVEPWFANGPTAIRPTAFVLAELQLRSTSPLDKVTEAGQIRGNDLQRDSMKPDRLGLIAILGR